MPESRPTQAEREASAWLVLLESASAPQAEIERFHAWLSASEDNKAAYAAVSGTVDKLGPLLASLPAHVLANAQTAANDHRAPRLNGWLIVASAAMFLLALMLAPWPALSPFAPSSAYATSVREVRSIALSDGSHVQLGPLASVQIGFDGRERRLLLKQGVIYVEVAHDPRPFVVATPFGDVSAAGTAFVVRIDAHDAVVTVIDGAVTTAPPSQASLLTRLSDQRARVRVSAGQELALGAHAPVTRLAGSAAQARLAWRDGHVAFDHARLGDAALEVTRFSGVRFEFADPALAELRVSGYFDGGDVDAFLAALHGNFAINATRDGEAVRLLRP